MKIMKTIQNSQTNQMSESQPDSVEPVDEANCSKVEKPNRVGES